MVLTSRSRSVAECNNHEIDCYLLLLRLSIHPKDRPNDARHPTGTRTELQPADSIERVGCVFHSREVRMRFHMAARKKTRSPDEHSGSLKKPTNFNKINQKRSLTDAPLVYFRTKAVCRGLNPSMAIPKHK